MKFGVKIPNRLGKNVRKPQGGLTHNVVVAEAAGVVVVVVFAVY